MPTNFPVSIDNYTNPNPTDDVSVVVHSTQHANHNDSIEAIEAKLGIDSSAVTSSIDYLLKSTSSVSPGHKHAATEIADGSVSNAEFQYLGNVTSDIQTQLNTKANSAGALTQFVGNGNWRVFYSDGSGDIIELSLGASGTFLKSNGASSAPTFATPSASVSIGDTITSGTEGSILFLGAAGVLAQDNSNLFWDDTNNKLGVASGGTKLSKFTVKQTATGAITGTSNTTNDTAVVGSGTLFLTEVGIGDLIEQNGFGYVLVTAITDNTHLTTSPAIQGNFGANALNVKHSISRWDDSSGAVRMILSDEGYLGIGPSVFKPLYPLHIVNSNGLAISGSGTGRQYQYYIDDPSGTFNFKRSDVSADLTFAFSSGVSVFSSTLSSTFGFQLNSGELNFISANGGGAGKIVFGRRLSDSNVACGAAVEFWPTNSQTTPAAAVMAPGGGSYYLKLMPSGSIEFTNSGNMTFDTTTGTKIGTATNEKLAFYNATPIIQPTALTTQLTTITATAPGTPDYAIQDLTNVAGYGFVTADEGQSFLKVVLNLQTRVAELETKLQALGLLA